MATFMSLDDLDVQDKRVLLRADLNVPMQDGEVTDATRIERVAPSIRELAEAGAKVVVLSHFGRPKGARVPEMSLAPLSAPLAGAIGRDVAFAADCVGPEAEAAVADLAAGEVLLLENLRFHAGEEANDEGFADGLAALGDLYVNDAFSCSHRAHASIEAITRRLPAAAGRLMQAELEALAGALDDPKRPLAAVVGGAKVSTKLAVLGHLVERVEVLIIGGGMANTFLHANGVAIGTSLCETEMAAEARAILSKAEAVGCEVLLPVDAVVAREFAAGAAHETVAIDAVPGDTMILDVGPDSVAACRTALERCRTLVWNGPLGAFEVPPFDAATNALAAVAAELSDAGHLLSVAGGGDTVAALAHAGVLERFSYVSTAGGAFLEWLEGRTLPGVAALQDAAKPA